MPQSPQATPAAADGDGIRHPQTLDDELAPQPDQCLPQVNAQDEQIEGARGDDDREGETLADVTVPEMPPPNPQRRKRRPLTALAQDKLARLKANFHAIPFRPRKTLDFSAHGDLFRALGLWDFAHLDLSFGIRSDLLMLLIASYDLSKRRSFVGDVEVSIGRADIARALMLPVEGNGEGDLDLFAKDESKEVIEEFISNYVFLEDEDDEDMRILPEEVVGATQMVKEGKAGSVDWAGLMLVLTEKELMEAPRSGRCYYASQLQCLMKFQHPGLFEEGGGDPDAVPVPEPESSMDVSDSMGGEEGDDEGRFCGDIGRLEEFRDFGFQRQGSDLMNFHIGGDTEELMNAVEDCNRGKQADWADGCKNGFNHCLRRCNSSEGRGMEFENLCKPEQVESDEFSNLERLTSTELLHAMGAGHVSYSPRMNALEQSTGDFISVGEDGNKNASVDPLLGGSFFFDNHNGKRHIDNVDIDDDVGQFHQNNQQKRMRCDGLWEGQAPSGFDSYMDQIQCTIGKAKMVYVEKEQACLEAHMQLQYLNEMLVQKDQTILTLEKMQVEEHQKWQQSIKKYEQELYILAKLVVNYKKALKATQSKFTEYRKKYPQGDEPLYRDVSGAGGLVLTSRELERLQLEKELEMRQIAEDMISAFQCDWLIKFENYGDWLMVVHQRLVELEGEVKLVKENFAECKTEACQGEQALSTGFSCV